LSRLQLGMGRRGTRALLRRAARSEIPTQRVMSDHRRRRADIGSAFLENEEPPLRKLRRTERVIRMTAPKTAAHNQGASCNLPGGSVYELAIAAAKEAKRINERFYEAKKIPPTNVVITALKRVAEGRVGYTIEAHADAKPKQESGDDGEQREQ
jgi:DNA-directed RNA polymerase subunit K/omega